MNNIMLPVEVMKLGSVILLPLFVVFLILLIIKNNVVKFVLHFFKMAAYFGLAYYLWWYYKNEDQIDIISTFTFIFCCYEGLDNLISWISILVDPIREYREKQKNINIYR